MKIKTRQFLLLLLIVCLQGCMGQEVRIQANATEDHIRQARQRGAYFCAPKSLAIAEARLERCRDELDLGNLIPAMEHLKRAESEAQLALTVSIPEKCIQQPKKPVLDSDGDGIIDSQDKCPNEPEDRDGFQDEDGCPDLDNDGDGIIDSQDKCPNEPEDRDGFQDEDGCPDLDNDGDGITDNQDKCPNEPEDRDGFQDEDGCPDLDNDGDTVADTSDECPNEAGNPNNRGCPVKYKNIVVTENKIELRQTIYFATNKARILPKSFSLLNEVAKALQDRPTIQVRIEGHTDSVGNDAYNLRLSQGRAAAVKSYLVKQGIEPGRLESVGYGEKRPIANNQTRVGRSMNRRVEFIITKP